MLSNVKPLAETSLHTNGTMSDRLVSNTTNDKMETTHQEISTSNSIYSGWLDENREQLNSNRYVIIDGDDDSETRTRHPDRFVQVNHAQLFTQQDADRARAILNTVSDDDRVLSSKWRKEASLDELKNHVFGDCSFHDLITDKTPDDNSPYKHNTESIMQPPLD